MPSAHAESSAERLAQQLRLALLGTFVLAVSQPIFDQIVRSPEFLRAHRLAAGTLWLFVAGMTFALPLVAVSTALAASWLGRRVELAALRVWLFIGLTFLVLSVLRQLVGGMSAGTMFTLAGTSALATVWLHDRSRWVREFGVLIGICALLSPVVFLLRDEVRPHLQSVEPLEVRVAGVEPTPVVLIVWDELPVTTLLDESGQVDSQLFPGFARLAESSTWYRNAMSPSVATSTAIPAIIASSDPVQRSEVELSARPTIFDLVEASHAMVAYSSLAGHLPPGVQRLGDRSPVSPWRVLANDLILLYAHLSMPKSIRARLAPVSAAVGGFRSGETKNVNLLNAIDAMPLAAATAPRPLFFYLHAGLPHHPWIHLPSGATYWSDDYTVAEGFRGAAGTGSWMDHPWPVARAFQRHLLQTMYADHLMDQLLDRLLESELWNSALVVVTADHGASFEPGRPLRRPTPETLAAVAGVPLFVKLPGQDEARIDDRPASTLDVLPTVAEVLSASDLWAMDGRSLVSPETTPVHRRSVHFPKQPPIAAEADLLDEFQDMARQRRLHFGRSEESLNPYLIGPYSQLVGQDIADFETTVRHGFAERTSQIPFPGWLEAHLEFELHDLEITRPLAFAVAVDETIRATTAVFPEVPRLSVLLPESSAKDLRGGDLNLYLIDVKPGRQPVLRQIATHPLRFTLSPDGSAITDRRGAVWKVDPGAYRGELQQLENSAVFGVAGGAKGRPPDRLVVFQNGRSVATVANGIPTGGLPPQIRFRGPAEQIFYVVFPQPVDQVRYFVLGPEGRASELEAPSHAAF